MNEKEQRQITVRRMIKIMLRIRIIRHTTAGLIDFVGDEKTNEMNNGVNKQTRA
jgi:hypothetical protein